MFRLHAILHDAAEAVQLQTDNGPCYCDLIGRGPNCCLLVHVTGILFCLHVKIFVPSILYLIDFCNSMSLIVLDIEVTEKTKIKERGLFVDGFLQVFSFCPPRLCTPNKQTTWNTSHLHGTAWSSGKLDYDKFFAALYDIKVMSAEVSAKGVEKCRLSTRLLGD